MINYSTHVGRAILIFFWCGLAASIVNMLWAIFHFNSLFIAWAVVIVNIIVVTLKNILLPAERK